MARSKIPGHSSLSKNGVLQVKTYLRVPYCLLKSKSFLLLSPLAVKVYFIMLRQWKTNDPDKPIEISIDKIREYCPSDYKPGKLVHRNKIMKAIKQLITYGFIIKVGQYKLCNLYYIEQKRFTAELR